MRVARRAKLLTHLVELALGELEFLALSGAFVLQNPQPLSMFRHVLLSNLRSFLVANLGGHAPAPLRIVKVSALGGELLLRRRNAVTHAIQRHSGLDDGLVHLVDDVAGIARRRCRVQHGIQGFFEALEHWQLPMSHDVKVTHDLMETILAVQRQVKRAGAGGHRPMG